MMTCQSFSIRNTRGVTAFPPKKKSRPEIKSLDSVMEKKMCHRFIFIYSYKAGGVPPSKDNLYKPRVYKTLGTQEYTFLNTSLTTTRLYFPGVSSTVFRKTR
jgi:hypothetical protein